MAKGIFDGLTEQNDYGETVMGQDGIESFMNSIGVDPTGLVCILIANYMEASYMGEFKWDEFKKGCSKLGCDSIDSWKKVVPRLT